MQLRIERRMCPTCPWGLVFCVLVIAALGIWNLASASRAAARAGVDAARRSTSAWAWSPRWWCAWWTTASSSGWRCPIYVLNIAARCSRCASSATRPRARRAGSCSGPLRVQPAEFMKIGVILMLAKFYHDDYRPDQRAYGLLRLWKPVLMVLVPFVLVLVQPDLGTALMIVLSVADVILFGRCAGTWWRCWWRGCWRCAASSGTTTCATPPSRASPSSATTSRSTRASASPAGWTRRRTCAAANYHAAQSKIAVGSGGITGKGWREGTQTGLSFLPEQHTDFIFSVWAEEHGFLACMLLLLLYGVILLIFARGGVQRAGPVRRVRRGGRGRDDLLAGVREHRDGDWPACR